MNRETRLFFLFVSPWLIGFLVLYLLPLGASLYLSFTRYSILSTPRWVGGLNYQACLLGWEPNFYNSIKVTGLYAILAVPLGLITALAAAWLLNVKGVRGMGGFRTIFYLPSLLPVAASGILWTWLFHPQYGLLNRGLALLGLPSRIEWLGDSRFALLTLVLISLWGFGGSMIVFLAALQGVDRSLYEAAELDGAGRWDRFRHVTIPQISPALFFNLVMGLIGATQVFSIVYILQESAVGGGIAISLETTQFYVLNIFNNGFVYDRFGLACAQAWILFLAVLLLTGLVFGLGKRRVHYER